MRTDTNDDYLPDNEGQDQTFDLWEFRGTNSYTSSIFLADSLVKVSRRIEEGLTLFCTRFNTRYSITLVFPLPAPAITKTGPFTAVTASN